MKEEPTPPPGEPPAEPEDYPDLFADIPPPLDEPAGPADPTDYIYFEPEHKPYTVVLYSMDAAMSGGDPLCGVSIAHLHALNAEEAAGIAVQDVHQQTKSPAWAFARAIYVTEGFHDDMRADPRRFQV